MFGAHSFGSVPYVGPLFSRGVIALIGGSELALSTVYEIHLATKEFITEPDDAPKNQPFFGSLDQPLRFSRSLTGTLYGLIDARGEMAVNNSGGEFDSLPEFYALDGREHEVRLGRDGTSYKDWPIVFKGISTGFHIEEEMLRIYLSDYAYKFDVPLVRETYSGEGGTEGGEELKGRRKPWALGFCENISPTLVQPNIQLYQVSFRSVQAIYPAVYTRGVALDYDGDFETVDELINASVTEGAYATCVGEGFFKINFLLDGHIVTADVQGDNVGGFVATTAGVVRRIVEAQSDQPAPIGFYEPSFTQFESDQPAPIGFYVGHDDSSTAADVIGRLVGSGAYIGFRRDGKLGIGQFSLPDPEVPPMMRFDETEIRDIRREPLPGDFNPPPWRVKVPYGRNWTVQTGSDVAGSVTELDPERAAWLAEEVRFATAENKNVQTNHPFSIEQEMAGFFRDEEDAQTEADRLMALYSPSRALYRVMLNLRPLGLDIGDVVFVTFERWGMADGKLLRVMAITEDAADMSAEILGYG